MKFYNSLLENCLLCGRGSLVVGDVKLTSNGLLDFGTCAGAAFARVILNEDGRLEAGRGI